MDGEEAPIAGVTIAPTSVGAVLARAQPRSSGNGRERTGRFRRSEKEIGHSLASEFEATRDLRSHPDCRALRTFVPLFVPRSLMAADAIWSRPAGLLLGLAPTEVSRSPVDSRPRKTRFCSDEREQRGLPR